MLYQPLLPGVVPYVLNRLGCCVFQEHLHHELELLYCVRGDYLMQIDKKEMHLLPGYAVLIGSMVPHEVISFGEDTDVVLIEIGPMFLGEKFRFFSGMTAEVFCMKETPDIKNTLQELWELTENPKVASDLLAVGNLYRLCGFLIGYMGAERANTEKKTVRMLPEIEKVLELVYYHYPEPIQVEDAANLCGYGKSNFCKIFKNTMGVSFHSYLNSFRIKNAGYLLCESKLSVDEVAARVGLSDAKTLCRVFKDNTGMTPGQYRNAYRTTKE